MTMPMPETEPLFSKHEAGGRPLVVLDAEDMALVDVIAERVAVKIGQGLLRLPPSVHAALGTLPSGGFYLAPTYFGQGAHMHEVRIYARPTGLELTIWDAVGAPVYRGEFL